MVKRTIPIESLTFVFKCNVCGVEKEENGNGIQQMLEDGHSICCDTDHSEDDESDAEDVMLLDRVEIEE